MFKFFAVFALVAVASAAPGLIAEHHAVVQPATLLAKTAVVDTSASSAITHQSFTNLERKVPVVHTVAAAPVLNAVAAPVLHTYEAAPLVKSVATPVASPVVHSYAHSPIVESYVSTPVVHSASLVHSAPVVHPSPIVYTAYH